jgi:hypothetical protein
MWRTWTKLGDFVCSNRMENPPSSMIYRIFVLLLSKKLWGEWDSCKSSLSTAHTNHTTRYWICSKLTASRVQVSKNSAKGSFHPGHWYWSVIREICFLSIVPSQEMHIHKHKFLGVETSPGNEGFHDISNWLIVLLNLPLLILFWGILIFHI